MSENTTERESPGDQKRGAGRPGVRPEDVEVGDRVDLVLHGATSTNNAKGTVVNTNRPRTLKNGITVRLDGNYQHCDKEYGTSVGSINRIVGDDGE